MVGTVLQCHTKMENSERFTRHYYEHRSVDDSKNIEFPNLSGLIKRYCESPEKSFTISRHKKKNDLLSRKT